MVVTPRLAGRVLPIRRLALSAVEGVWGRGGIGGGVLPQILLFSVSRRAGRFGLPGRAAVIAAPHHGARGPAGKSFIRCCRLCLAVRPILATRTIENKRDRIAHHPDRAVYDLFGSSSGLHLDHRAFIPERPLMVVCWVAGRRPCWGCTCSASGRRS